MKRIEAIVRPERVDRIADLLDEAGLHGFTISDARGHGRSPDRVGEYRGVTYELIVTHKIALTVLVDDDEVDAAVDAISRGAATGSLGDGIIAVSPLDAVYQISAYGSTPAGGA